MDEQVAKRYLVTGGLGFIGSALSRALLATGAQVRILDNSFRGARERLGENAAEFDIQEGDIRDATVVTNAMQGVDAVCHLAYVNGTSHFYERPELVLDVGVKGMINVLDACREHSVGELFLASSSEVYQTPPTVPTDETVPLSVPDVHNPRYSYGGGKIISELMALNYGRKNFDRVVIFRPHNVYGPNMGFKHVIPEFATRMLERQSETGATTIEFPIQGDGKQTRAFIYIDDFVDGVLRVIESGAHLAIYNVGTMEERSILEIAELVGRSLGLELKISPGPAPAGGTMRRCPDTAALSGLGFSPSVSLQDGIRQTVEWYRQHRQKSRMDAA